MCKNRVLALSGPFRIEACGECENLSIHLGPVTIRVDEKALRSLHALTGDALRCLQPRRFTPNQTAETTVN